MENQEQDAALPKKLQGHAAGGVSIPPLPLSKQLAPLIVEAEQSRKLSPVIYSYSPTKLKEEMYHVSTSGDIGLELRDTKMDPVERFVRMKQRGDRVLHVKVNRSQEETITNIQHTKQWLKKFEQGKGAPPLPCKPPSVSLPGDHIERKVRRAKVREEKRRMKRIASTATVMTSGHIFEHATRMLEKHIAQIRKKIHQPLNLPEWNDKFVFAKTLSPKIKPESKMEGSK